MKRATVFCFAIVLLISMFAGSALAAPEYDEDVDSNAVMLLDATTGQVLYQKNADEQIYPASTTKIMTCIVTLENANLEDIVTVGSEGDWTGSGYSLLGLKNGEEICLRDLLYGMMLVSGNDAAAAIAVYVGGSIEGFADMMNEKAQELGMTGSHFVTPHGVDTDDHYVTARDMAKLALYAMQNEQFMEIVGTASYDFPATNLTEAETKENTNKLLLSEEPEYYSYATGIKTGATPKAYRCLVSSAEKDGMKLLCLVYGDETESGSERWTLAKSLFEYGFNNYETVDMQSLIDSIPLSVNVADASEDDEQGSTLTLNVEYEGDAYVTMDKDAAEELLQGGLNAQVELSNGGEELQAPVNAGDVVGVVIYTNPSSGETITQANLTASRDVFVDIGNINMPEQVVAQGLDTGDSASSIAWLWFVLGGVVVAAAAVFAVGLIRAMNQRKRKRKYPRRVSVSRTGKRN